jgi:hypothetical protein
VGRASRQTDDTGPVHVARRVHIPCLWRMHESLHPLVLPSSRRRHVLETLQVAYLGRHRLHDIIHFYLLRRSFGQLHTHESLLDGVRFQVRFDTRLYMYGHKRDKCNGWCLRCYQRRLCSGIALHLDVETHICAESAEDRVIRDLLPWSARCRCEWRTDVLADWYVSRGVNIISLRLTSADYSPQRRDDPRTLQEPPSTSSCGRRLSCKRA